MKNGIKRVLCLAAALLMLVFAMTACGGSETASTGSQTNSNTSGEIIVEPPRPSAPTNSKYTDPNWDPYATISDAIKGSTVRFATWIDHTTTEGAVPLANFENDTGLKVELYMVKQAGYVNALMTKMAS